MLLKGSHSRVLSRFRVYRGRHCASLACRIPPWLPKWESASRTIAYAWKENYTHSVHVEHLDRLMPFQFPCPGSSLVVLHVQILVNRQNQPMGRPLGNSQFPPAERRVSIPAGGRFSSQGWSSVPCSIQGQNSTSVSSLNDSRVGDITQLMTSTQSAQRRSIITPTAMAGTGSCNTPAPSRTTQADSMHPVVSSPASGIASTPTAHSGFEQLPTAISNPDARAIITNTW
jgi:hypothetical protein